MKNKPLISVIILCYKNYNLIMDAINSTLNQDYPNIELIISNDCSDDFDLEELHSMFENYKEKYWNIKNVIINKNNTNIGTTKHVNKMVKQSSGKFFKLLAADDLFYVNNALSKYVEFLETTKAYFVVAQSAAYDEKLENFLRFYPNHEHMKILESYSAKELFRILAKDCIINAPAVCFAKKYVKEFGYFDERYFYADDWPAWIRFTRLGNRIEVLNETLVIYRFGGVSNTNKSNETQISSKVWDEYFYIMENEGIKYFKELGVKSWLKCRQLVMNHHLTTQRGWARYKTIFKNLDIYLASKLIFLKKNPYAMYILTCSFLSLVTIFGNSKINQFLQDNYCTVFLDIIAFCGILGFGVMILLYGLFFIYDFLFKKN